MQPRDIERVADLVQTIEVPPGNPVFRSTIPGNVEERDVLRNIISHDGNFIAPNEQHYEVLLEHPWKGSGRYTIGTALAIADEGVRGFMPGLVDQPDLHDYLYNSCLSKTFDQVRGNIDLAVEVAQAGQTIGMVRGATKVVDFARDLYLSVRHGRPRGLIDRFVHGTGIRFDRTKSVASLWLEYQYGWAPAVGTVFDCVDALMKPARGDSWPLLVLKARAKERELVDLKRQSNLRLDAALPYFVENVSGRLEQRGEMLTQWRIPPSRLLDLSRWTSFNPSGIAWELLPYSFVVDWFVDVGGYLRDLESAFLYGSSYVRGYFTHTRRYEMTHRISQEISAGSLAAIGVFEASRYNSEKKREIEAWPFPKSPTFRPKLGWQRLVSAAGLLAGFLGRK